jgi:hypothetical protein
MEGRRLLHKLIYSLRKGRGYREKNKRSLAMVAAYMLESRVRPPPTVRKHAQPPGRSPPRTAAAGRAERGWRRG